MDNLSKSFKTISVLVGALFVMATTRAQQSSIDNLTLDACKEMVLLNNEEAIIASAEVEAKYQRTENTLFAFSVRFFGRIWLYR